MASKRQIEANRANAAKSTGPQTSAGKATSSRNAYRHGLSGWDEAAGSGYSGFDLILAEESKAQIWKPRCKIWLKGRQDRLRTLRLGLILAVIKGAEPTQLRYLSSLERYEKAALSRQRRAINCVKRDSR